MSHATVEAAKKSDIKKTASHHAAAQNSAKDIHAEESCTDRLERIAVAAYYLAERRGFCGGDPVADWLAAEAEIDMLNQRAETAAVH